MSYVTDNPIDPRRDRRGRNLEVGFTSLVLLLSLTVSVAFWRIPCLRFNYAGGCFDASNMGFFEQENRFTRIDVDHHRVWDMEHLHRSAGALLLGHRLEPKKGSIAFLYHYRQLTLTVEFPILIKVFPSNVNRLAACQVEANMHPSVKRTYSPLCAGQMADPT